MDILVNGEGSVKSFNSSFWRLGDQHVEDGQWWLFPTVEKVRLRRFGYYEKKIGDSQLELFHLSDLIYTCQINNPCNARGYVRHQVLSKDNI